MNDEEIDKVYEMLTSQRFTDWYEGDFIEHIEGQPDAKPIHQIKTDLKRLLA